MGIKSVFGGGLPRKIIILVLVAGAAWYLLPKYYKKPADIKGFQSFAVGRKYLPKEVNGLINVATKKAQEASGAVLGTATEMVKKSVSKSAASVPNMIYDQAFTNLVKQIDKLPKDQREELQKVVCK